MPTYTEPTIIITDDTLALHVKDASDGYDKFRVEQNGASFHVPFVRFLGGIKIGDAVSITRGSGVPNPNDGTDADIYVQTGSGGHLWFKQSGDWVQVI